MKPTAIFLNTARAHMVDYDALYELLKNKKILGAALDVFPSEPLSIDNPFLTLDNVTLTSHRCGDTVNAYSDSPAMMMEDYTNYLKTNKHRFFVNRVAFEK
jgi:D-3-phosphoglycerate dehydrogenase